MYLQLLDEGDRMRLSVGGERLDFHCIERVQLDIASKHVDLDMEYVNTLMEHAYICSSQIPPALHTELDSDPR
jgi:hypothetical protein